MESPGSRDVAPEELKGMYQFYPSNRDWIALFGEDEPYRSGPLFGELSPSEVDKATLHPDWMGGKPLHVVSLKDGVNYVYENVYDAEGRHLAGPVELTPDMRFTAETCMPVEWNEHLNEGK